MNRLLRLVVATTMIALSLQAVAVAPAGAAFVDEESFTATSLDPAFSERGNSLGGAFFQYPGVPPSVLTVRRSPLIVVAFFARSPPSGAFLG